MNHLRLFRSDKAMAPAVLYAPALIPMHGNQIEPQGMGDLDGLFSKLIHAVAKPFQKIFPAKTFLGKVMDPLGLTDPKRNLNLAGRVADVVGTAAAVVMGGWAIGAAAAGTGAGFWATAGTGAKLVGGALLTAGKAAGGVAGGVAKAAAPAILSGAFGGSNPSAESMAIQPPQFGMDPSAGGVTPQAWDTSGSAMASFGGSAGGGIPAGGGQGGGGGTGTTDDVPSTSVDITAPAPSGPNWLLIGAAAIAVYMVVKSTSKKKVTP